ncbi:MAG: multicopper oxidase domain-containing protein, partial [Flavobacteriales bacterium]
KKPAKVYAILGANGRHGIMAREGDRFAGTLLNASDEPLQMHWHGQMLAPFDQDRARPGGATLPVGQSDTHDFLLTPGTHWMHSHSLSEQQLLAAPMIARERDAGDVQDVVIMLHDFAFRSPQEILAELGGADAHAGLVRHLRHGL